MRFIKTVSLEFVLFLFVVVHCKDPPVLLATVKPEYRVKEGETVKLWCKFSGINDSMDNRTLTAWQNPKGDIITDQYERFKMRLGRYLKIRRVKVTDQGKYVCIAYNHFGKVEEEIQLVVQASNSGIIRPLPITKPTPTALSTQTRYPLAVSTTKRPPRRCNIRPSKIPLIDDSPPKFKNPSKNRDRFLEFVEGQQIKLKCHAHGARPLNVTWLKNKKLLSKADRRHLRSKGWVLNFRALTLNDAGTYTCTVENAYCSIQRTFVVKVVERGRPILQELQPKILENVLKNATATVGEEVTFVCSALSKSHPEFHFLKWKSSINVSNGSDPFEFVDFSKSKFREIREIPRQHKGQRQVYTHRLIVRNVTLADEAKYTCVVGNSEGYVSEHAFLTVLSQEALQSDEPYAGGGIGVEQSSMTKAPKKSPRTQSDKEILVEEIPLAALIGVPIAVLILLIGTIVWCYFMTRKHHSLQHWKDENNEPLPQDQKKDLPVKISVPGKEETRNVSFNVYVDHPNDRVKTRLTEKQSGTHVKCTSHHVKCASQHVKCDLQHGKCDLQHGKCDSQRGKCAIQRDPPLDGLIIHNEPPRTHSNRTNHRKRHEREELEFNESSGCEIKCSGV